MQTIWKWTKKHFVKSGDLDVEDFGICKIFFYSDKELKEPDDERTRLCGICELCTTTDSEEFKYCVAMQWNIRRDNSLMF